MQKDDKHLNSGVLMRVADRFVLEVCTSLRENTLNPHTVEGAGEILHEHGHKPWLMLVLLNEKLKLEWDDFPVAVTFCDEQGANITYSDFKSLETIIERMGFHYDEVRSDAVKLGLATEVFNFSQVDDSNIEDFFF